MLASVKIEQDKEYQTRYRVYKDGQKIDRVNHIDFNIDSDDRVPQVNIGIVGGLDFDGMADIHFDYSPYTVKEACKILKDKLLKHSDLYAGFSASIKSAIDEAPNYISNKELSEKILDRIVGEK